MDKLLNQLGEVAPNSTAVPLLQAELLIAQDRAAEATKLIETVRDKDPKEIAYWIALVNLAIRENQWDKAGQSLEEAEKKFGDRATLRLARAQFWTRKGQKAPRSNFVSSQRNPKISLRRNRWGCGKVWCRPRWPWTTFPRRYDSASYSWPYCPATSTSAWNSSPWLAKPTTSN